MDGGGVVLVWLKEDDAIRDDADVYWSPIALASADLAWPAGVPATSSTETASGPGAVGERGIASPAITIESACACCAAALDPSTSGGQVSFTGRIQTPDLPLGRIGITAKGMLDIQGAFSAAGCDASLQSQIAVAGELAGSSVTASLQGSGAVSAKFKADSQNRVWKFDKGTGSLGLQGSIDEKGALVSILKRLPSPPAVLAGVAIEAIENFVRRVTPAELEDGVNVTIGVSWEGEYTNGVPIGPVFVLPDKLDEKSLSISLGPYLKTKVESQGFEAKVSGFVKWTLALAPTIETKELTVNLALDVQSGWGIYNRTWTGGYVASGEDAMIAAGLDVAEADEGVAFTVDRNAALGTGSVYGSRTPRSPRRPRRGS